MGEVTDRLQRLSRGGTLAEVTMVGLQDSGVTRYSTGTAGANQFGQVEVRLTELFSDRHLDLDNAPPNPFSNKAADSSTLTIDLNRLTATMVLHSWGDATSSFSVRDQGDVLFGIGGPAGSSSNRAYYLIAVGEVQT